MENQDMLSSILSDPEKLQQAISMATSLLGGAETETKSEATQNQTAQNQISENQMMKGSSNFDDPSVMLMQKAMPFISQIAQSGHNAVSYEKKQLLQAVKPFVSEPVQNQIDHAIKLVGMAKMAKSVLRQFGGKNDV